MKIAQLLGYKDYAEYTLKKRMAENSKSVYKLLNQLLEAYTPTAQQEYKEIQELARKEQGADFVVMPWDWNYYSNKLKDKKFNINEEMLRPYFELEQVKKECLVWLKSYMESRSGKTQRFRFTIKRWKPLKCLIKTVNS